MTFSNAISPFASASNYSTTNGNELGSNFTRGNANIGGQDNQNSGQWQKRHQMMVQALASVGHTPQELDAVKQQAVQQAQSQGITDKRQLHQLVGGAMRQQLQAWGVPAPQLPGQGGSGFGQLNGQNDAQPFGSPAFNGQQDVSGLNNGQQSIDPSAVLSSAGVSQQGIQTLESAVQSNGIQGLFSTISQLSPSDQSALSTLIQQQQQASVNGNGGSLNFQA